MMEEAYALLYLWINNYNYEDRDKYKELYYDDLDNFNKKIDLIIDMYQYVINNIKIDKDTIEYYFKERNHHYCTLASLALLMDFGKMHDEIPSYDEKIKPLTLAERVALFAMNINDEESANTPKEELTTESDLINFIESSDFDNETKWEAIKIFNNQEKYYNEAAGILQEAMDLLNSKYSEAINELAYEFYNYWNERMEGIDIIRTLSDKFKISWKMSEAGCVLLPVIFSPFQISVAANGVDSNLKDIFRLGVLLDERFELLIERRLKKEDIVEIGKLLSDKSKVDILELVSQKPCYGKELANALNLSTATISYHVNALLKANFLKAEIISNKVYYSINIERISAKLDGIKRFFAEAK